MTPTRPLPLAIDQAISEWVRNTGSHAHAPSVRRLCALAYEAGLPHVEETPLRGEIRELTAVQRKEAQEWVALGLHPADYALRRHCDQVQVERAVGWQRSKK